MPETMDARITRLLLEHAQNVPAQRPFPLGLSIRKDLAVESLSLVSVTLAGAIIATISAALGAAN